MNIFSAIKNILKRLVSNLYHSLGDESQRDLETYEVQQLVTTWQELLKQVCDRGMTATFIIDGLQRLQKGSKIEKVTVLVCEKYIVEPVLKDRHLGP